MSQLLHYIEITLRERSRYILEEKNLMERDGRIEVAFNPNRFIYTFAYH